MARAGATLVLGGALAIAGCSSSKPVGAGANGKNPLIGENGVGGNTNSLVGFQHGKVPGGTGEQGPLDDIHFAYNEYTVEPQDDAILKKNADWLNSNSSARVQVEGHCDERGSEEYNIALGAKRAQAAKDYLVTLGIPANRISTISYGKELPVCTEHDETCWAQNRRDHFAIMPQ
ncbi:MAG TPA: peptidoglycan-associated lipoprotein Pal [Candidatus Binataceae bacterium]|nr:peptidoglycan-associated lipoprotein Pal [Candidatus Binataceae bacterium]